jgi:NADH-quinone oxidoreductase subunit L
MLTYALIPLLPFAGFLIAGLFGKYLKEKAAYFPIAGVIGAFILSVFALVDVVSGASLNENFYSWISIGTLQVNVG